MKALVIILLALGIFGTAGYYAYELFVRPAEALRAEKQLPLPPPPPDPTLPELQKCLDLKKQGKILEARTALEEFIERFPESTKLDDAKDALGEINTDIFLSPRPAPEKEVYIVKSGDVLNRVATRLKTTPELIMRANNLEGTMLRIGQKLAVSPAEFSLSISSKRNKVTVLNGGKFFKHYPVLSWPPIHAKKMEKGGKALSKQSGKVVQKFAQLDGAYVTFVDKGYANASHSIQLSLLGYTLYSEPDPSAGAKASKPPSGIALAPEHMQELAVILRRNHPVTLE